MNLSPPRGEAGKDWATAAADFARSSGLSAPALLRFLESIQGTPGSAPFSAALRDWLAQQEQRAAHDPDFPPPQLPALAATARAAPELVVAYDLFDPHSERIRALRMDLMLRQREDSRNLLAVVSPGPGEGRSRLAAELAIACAQTGEPTLLVDADLRRPSQHRFFQAANDQGLATAIATGTSPRLQAVHGLPALAVMTSGPPPVNALELLSGAAFGNLLATWRRQFRHIILDTPPSAKVSDALAVAMQGCAVLLVSRAHHTRLADTRAMLRRLSTTPARVLGSVVNRF